MRLTNLAIVVILLIATINAKPKNPKKEKKHKEDDMSSEEIIFDDGTVGGAEEDVEMFQVMDKLVDNNLREAEDPITGVGFGRTDKFVDEAGTEFIRMTQKFAGVEIFGMDVTEHVYNGGVMEIKDKQTGQKTGEIVTLPKKKKRTGKLIKKIEKKLKKFDPKDYDPSAALAKLKESKGAGSNIKDESAKVIIYLDKKGKKPIIAFKVSFLSLEKPPTNPTAIYDAKKLRLMEEWDEMAHADVQMGTGPGGNVNTGKYQYGTDKPKLIVNDLGDGQCSYETKKATIHDLKQGWDMGANNIVKYPCYEQASDEANGGYSAVNDALYNAGIVYDMMMQWYERPGPRTAGTVIKVHYGSGMDFAAYYPGGGYVYIGDGASQYPLTTLEMIGHELGHALTQDTSKLQNSQQSGALYEAFSDMMAKAAEYFVHRDTGKVEWKIGRQTFKDQTKQLRCMDNPTCPGYYGNGIDNVNSITGQYMGVYPMGGPIRKVFYLLSKKYNPWDAFDIFYIANTRFWTPTVNFKEGAQLTLRALSEMQAGLHLPFTYGWIDINDVIGMFQQVGISCTKTGDTFSCTGNNLEYPPST